MELIWNAGERERIIKAWEETNIKIFSDELKREYSINFTVTNPAIAEYVLFSLLHDKLDGVDIGINITSINSEKYKSNDEFKRRLIRMVEEM